LELYKFECIFEQLKLFASLVPYIQAKESREESKGIDDFIEVESRFIQLLHVGMLQLEVMAAKSFENLDSDTGQRSPLLEIRCKNDLLKVWACSDSICLIVNAIAELLDAQGAEQAHNAQVPSSAAYDVENGKEHSADEQRADFEASVAQTERDGRNEHATGNATYSQETLTGKTNLLSDALLDLSDTRADLTDTEERRSRRESFGQIESDEEFCVVDKIPGSGITAPGGKPRARFLFDDDPPITVDNYLKRIDDRSEKTVLLAAEDSRTPLVRYVVSDVSLELHLYGGTDFGTSKPPSKPYSMSTSGRIRRDNCPAGGCYRDYSAHVELQLSKVKFLFEIYEDDAPISSTRLFTIERMEIMDRMMASKINKLLYPYVCDQSFPRRSHSPVFSLRVCETAQNEGRMKVSLMPLRINADQDTLEFLEDYLNDLSAGVHLLHPGEVEMPEKPLLEMCGNEDTHFVQHAFVNAVLHTVSPSVHNANAQPTTCESKTSSDQQQRMDSGLEPDLLNIYMDDNSSADESDRENVAVGKPSGSAADLFDDSGPVSGDIMELMHSSSEPHSSTAVLYQYNRGTANAEQFQTSRRSDLSPPVPKGTNENLLGGVCRDEESDAITTSSAVLSQQSQQQHAKAASVSNGRRADSLAKGKIYFVEFTFSPSTVIRLDLSGKRVRSDRGWIVGFVLGLSDFKCTEIRLKELHCSRGLLGYDRCAKFALDAWLKDINNKQLMQFITSYAPIKSLVELGLGIRDLFLMPVQEYRREEGHVVKGLQKGAESFGLSTATATVDVLQKMVGVVQGVAELAFDIVSPDSPAVRYRRRMIGYSASRPPSDIRDGFNMAYEAMRQEVRDTAYVLHLAAQEDRACGYWAVRGLLRHATPTVIRPIVAMSRATAHILSGLRNQMKPISHKFV
uniref:Autophagy-related protein 2 n=1 Tax=Gongylonema pulchrum TaxID=637853 RepID=A0A183CW36_9BILA